MRLQKAILASQCHIDKGLILEEIVEYGGNVALVVVPSKAEVLRIPRDPLESFIATPPPLDRGGCCHVVVRRYSHAFAIRILWAIAF